jgi:hypothetical protein
MKKFEAPELEILNFSVVDVIATSNEPESPFSFEDDGIWA